MSKAGSTLFTSILSGTSTPRLRLPRLVDNSSIGDAEPDLTAPSILAKSMLQFLLFWGSWPFQVSFGFLCTLAIEQMVVNVRGTARSSGLGEFTNVRL
jgi:hypothetical protein